MLRAGPYEKIDCVNYKLEVLILRKVSEQRPPWFVLEPDLDICALGRKDLAKSDELLELCNPVWLWICRAPSGIILRYFSEGCFTLVYSAAYKISQIMRFV